MKCQNCYKKIIRAYIKVKNEYWCKDCYDESLGEKCQQKKNLGKFLMNLGR